MTINTKVKFLGNNEYCGYLIIAENGKIAWQLKVDKVRQTTTEALADAERIKKIMEDANVH